MIKIKGNGVLILFALFLCLFLSKCGNRYSEALSGIDRSFNFSFIDTTSSFILPLETTEKSIIGTVEQILFDNDLVFIQNRNDLGNKSIVVFDLNGKFKTVIDKQGRGPGEYVELIDFDLNRETKEIVILDARTSKLLFFSYFGKLTREVNLPETYGSCFALLDSAHIVYWESNILDFQINIASFEGDVIEKLYSVTEAQKVSRSAFYPFFSKQKDNVSFYIPMWDDKIYKLSADSHVSVFNLGLEEKMARSKADITSFNSNEPTNKTSYVSSLIMNEAGQFYARYYYLNAPVVIQGNINTGVTNSGVIRFNASDLKYGFALDYPISSYNEYFVNVIEPYRVMERYLTKFPMMKGDDNVCLFFFRLSI